MGLFRREDRGRADGHRPGTRDRATRLDARDTVPATDEPAVVIDSDLDTLDDGAFAAAIAAAREAEHEAERRARSAAYAATS